MKAVLMLKDGTMLQGIGFGAQTTSVGEVVFNTSMMGYQEALTDPSYGGQMLVLSYPLIGNYGINKFENESSKVQPAGFIVRELSPNECHRDSISSVDKFLKDNSVPGIYGIDTRFLVQHIRDKGVMSAILATSNNEIDSKALLKKLEFDYSAIDFVSKVSTKKPLIFGKNGKLAKLKKIVLIDYGVKMGIVRELVARGAQVTVLPYSANAEDVKKLDPDGIVLSNGPGDPAILTEAHKTIQGLAGYKPIMGICLGHQLLAHAFGGDTFKMKFGHRGSNHAVMNLLTKQISITTQNHGFAVNKMPNGFVTTHINLNDKTVEGMMNKQKQIFSVQYHPEASPGPHDSRGLFDEFIKMI